MKNYLIVVIVSFLVGLGVTAYYFKTHQPEPVVRTETIHDTKVEVKYETKYITRTIKQADGTVINETINENTNTHTQEVISKVTEIKPITPKYRVSLAYGYNFTDKSTVKGLTLEKHFDANITYGILALDNKTVGLVIGVSL